MKHTYTLKCLLAAAFCLAMPLLAQAQTQGFDFDTLPDSAGEDVSNSDAVASESVFNVDFKKEIVSGGWIWIDDSGDDLDQAVSIALDSTKANTLYVGGNDGLYVSQDAGENWTQVFRLTAEDGANASLNDVTAGLSDEQIIQYKRDFIYNELVTAYDTSFADVIIDDITDDEFLRAETVDDIDIFNEYDLDIERDLTHAFESITRDDEEDDSDTADNQRFIDRYAALIAQGADWEDALESLSGKNAVWDIISEAGSTWALTSDALHISRNSGKDWKPALETSLDRPFTALAVDASGLAVAVGTIDGIQISRDGGKTWSSVSTDAVVLKMAWTPDGKLMLATATGAFALEADDTTLTPLPVDLRNDEVILDIAVSERNEVFFLTENTLFYRIPDGRISMVTGIPFDTEFMRQIIIDKTTDHIIIRTDLSIYELNAGKWYRQTEGLFGDITRSIVLLRNNKKASALLVTDSGIMTAITSTQFLTDTAKYDLLKRQWAQEPTEGEIIQAALEAHGLDDSSMEQWKARIWTSLLLPKVNFTYYKQNTATNRPIVTDTFDTDGYMTRDLAWDQQRRKIHYWEVMAHWDIAIDVRNREELNVQKMMYTQSRERQKLVTLVSKVIRNRHKKQMSALKGRQSKTAKAEIKRTLEIAELEAQLYYLTGGYFKLRHD